MKQNIRIYQSGAALIVSLIILLVLGFLAVQGMQTSTLEEKMAGNFRSKKLSFEAAEAALIEAEKWLEAQLIPPRESDDGNTGVWAFGKPKIHQASFWGDAKPADAAFGALTDHNLPNLEGIVPLWIIEQRGMEDGGDKVELGYASKAEAPPPVYRFRITAYATDASGTSKTLLQSHYEKAFP